MLKGMVGSFEENVSCNLVIGVQNIRFGSDHIF